MKHATILLLVAVSGCMTADRADQIIAKQPVYMQEHIGEVKFQPLSLESIFYMGEVKGRAGKDGAVYNTEPNNPIHLYAMADKVTLIHEAYHSFEVTIKQDDPNQWYRYYKDFNDGTPYGGYMEHLLCSMVPGWMYLPLDGHAYRYGNVNHWEDGACFWMRMAEGWEPKITDETAWRKYTAVDNFVNGRYVGK